MLKLSCPSCGAEVVFRSKSSVFAVCSCCKSTLVRQDMNLELVGKMSDLQDDITPLQIGTKGQFDGKTFELIGRLKIGYEDGFWNEWYCLYAGDSEENNKDCWLAEAQGFYALCFPLHLPLPPALDSLEIARSVTIDGFGLAEVEDARNVHVVLAEGELPLQAAQGRKSYSVDLSASGLRMATLEYGSNGFRAYHGKYQDFDEFQFQNLRQIDGWF